jgi:hypothetical protein
MENVFIRFGHGYEQSDRGRCTAFDGFTVIAEPLGGFDREAREGRSFPRKDGSAGVTYSSHAIKLARGEFGRDLYILMQHGGGREVLRVPSFSDNGALEAHILALPDRLQYALLYTIWNTASAARHQAQDETKRTWAQAFADGRIKKHRANKHRGARVEIVEAE